MEKNLPSSKRFKMFFMRGVAVWIDVFLYFLIMTPITAFITLAVKDLPWFQEIIDFMDLVVIYVLPPLLVLFLWNRYRATPGKIVAGFRIVDHSTGQKPSLSKLIIRYLSYIVSIIPLGLGFIWVLIDKEGRGWHDIISGTQIIEQQITSSKR